MTVSRPRQPKRNSADEILRVAQLYDLLKTVADEHFPESALVNVTIDHHMELLALSERIAARTED